MARREIARGDTSLHTRGNLGCTPPTDPILS
ncbi:hypothetical protein EES40_26270 [Streptomyces sp. ADI93-02]|nr:hypothetical protein EES40_26270 [Streptomyces sp. ADI93-02]